MVVMKLMSISLNGINKVAISEAGSNMSIMYRRESITSSK